MIPRKILKTIQQTTLLTNHFVTKMAGVAVLFLGLLLLSSCATKGFIRPTLPADASFNPEAGRGGWLLVKLKVNGGEELSFVVDTGAPQTILDRSLEPRLGKRLGTKKLRYSFYQNTSGGIYAAPHLYLCNTPLLTDDRILTDDLHQKISTGVDGILGMDCLRHYCIQFDFASRKMRFLDPGSQSNENWGKAFPLTILFGCVFTRMDFFGQGSVYARLDTGFIGGVDVSVSPRQFRNVVKRQTPVEMVTPEGQTMQTACVGCFEKAAFGGETYTNFAIAKWSSVSLSARTLIGLQFLGRHCVTFDFPKRMLYLKQESVGPLASGFFLTIEAEKFLAGLGKADQLPGLSNKPAGDLQAAKMRFSGAYPFSQGFDFHKTGDSSVYHYDVLQAFQNGPWKLKKAWRTDQNGKMIEEYPLKP
jgi:hypothetical protein